MNILDDLRAELIAVRKSLGQHIAFLEARNKIHAIGQDSDEATTELLGRLKQYRSEVQGWLIHLPSGSEALTMTADFDWPEDIRADARRRLNRLVRAVRHASETRERFDT